MMGGIYRVMLRLYPAAYRTAFGTEMLTTFEEAARAPQAQGWWASGWFATRETAGLAKGVVVEHAARWRARESYASEKCEDAGGDLARLIHCMEYAIAHHDFRKARHYSDAERQLRARLRH